MSVTIELDLPEVLANEALAGGLLEPVSVGNLIATELRRRKAGSDLNRVLDAIRAQPGQPMSEQEIAAEVRAVGVERIAHEAGH